MNVRETIAKIKAHHMLEPDAKVGIVASYGKAAMIEGDGRTLSVIATTDDIDLQDEVVVPGGSDITYFNQNGKIFADHSYEIERCVAVRRTITPFVRGESGQAGWKVRAFMLPGNPLADAILAIAEEDGIGVSIGFQADEWGDPTPDETMRYGAGKGVPKSVVRKWKWLELSFTAFPCNVSCQSLSVHESDRAKGVMENLLTKGRITRHVAVALGYKEAQPRRVVVKVA